MFRKTIIGLTAATAVAAATLGMGTSAANAKVHLNVGIGVPVYGYGGPVYYGGPYYQPYYGGYYADCQKVFVGYKKKWSNKWGKWVKKPVYKTTCY